MFYRDQLGRAMHSIRLQKISKKFEDTVFNDLSLTIPSGKFFALLGPSGCGKSTLLRIIAGLDSVDSGNIFLGNQNITNTPAHQREIHLIFQSYALFEHYSIFENIAYGLRIRKVPQPLIEKKVNKLLKSFHLENLKHKSPSTLSGGQQQRVAIARAIANEPKVLLLDEPLAALDLKLREKMLLELMDLQEELQTTFIYITHNQEEALAVADHMAIMDANGKIIQCADPQKLYESPGNSYIANFVGLTNLLSKAFFDTNKIPINHCSPRYSIRPENIQISKKPFFTSSINLKGQIDSIVYQGCYTKYCIRLPDQTKLHVFSQNTNRISRQFDYDDSVFISWEYTDLVALEN